MEHGAQRAFVRIGAGQLAAVGLGGVAGKLHLRRLAVFKDEEQISRVVAGEDCGEEALALVKAELAGQIVAEGRGLAIWEVGQARFIDLRPVGKDEQLLIVRRLAAE